MRLLSFNKLVGSHPAPNISPFLGGWKITPYSSVIVSPLGFRLRLRLRPDRLGFSKLIALIDFDYRTRYFSDSGIIGTKEFVAINYRRFKHIFQSKHEKKPKPIKGLDGVYSLKRLAEA